MAVIIGRGWPRNKLLRPRKITEGAEKYVIHDLGQRLLYCGLRTMHNGFHFRCEEFFFSNAILWFTINTN